MIQRDPIIINIFLCHFHTSFEKDNFVTIPYFVTKWNQLLSHDPNFKHIVLRAAHCPMPIDPATRHLKSTDPTTFPLSLPLVYSLLSLHGLNSRVDQEITYLWDCQFPFSTLPSLSHSTKKNSSTLIKSYSACSMWLTDLTINSWPLTPSESYMLLDNHTLFP